MKPNATAHFCKEILIIAAVEINREKYAIFQIHCCTICPTFGSISSKYIIQSFVHLKIIWLVDIMGGESNGLFRW